MTQAQEEAQLCGLVPEENDARFFSQHLAAYAFTRQFVHGKRVLEIGFGQGYGSNYLAETAKEVVGIDSASGNISRAQLRYLRHNLRFLHMNGQKLDFPDESFDVIGSFQVIEHIPEPELPNYLTQIRRVLRSDGVCVISTLNLEHNQKPGQAYQKLCFHEKEFTGPQLQELLGRFFPSVKMHGLYLSFPHRICQRLKKWGLMKWGPRRLNPIARFYDHMGVEAFQTQERISSEALDLFALCRKHPAR